MTRRLWRAGDKLDHTSRVTIPIVVSNTLTVASGATLSVAPGSTLEAADGALLDVVGTLTAQGTSAQPIVFTSGNPPSAWKTMRAQSPICIRRRA
jgi:hypothetical protein